MQLSKLLWPMLLPRAQLATSGVSTAPRIVNVVSIADRVSAGGMSAYSASKHAFGAFSDALRVEMAQHNVRVSIIEPGFMKTPIVTNVPDQFAAKVRSLPADVRARYTNAFLERTLSRTAQIPGIAGDPQTVVDALKHAIGHAEPRHRCVSRA